MELESQSGERVAENVYIQCKREAEATFAGYERDFRKEQRKSKHSPAVAPSSAALQEREKKSDCVHMLTFQGKH